MAGLLCAIHQPNFLPRLSTLAKIYAADKFLFADPVFARSRVSSDSEDLTEMSCGWRIWRVSIARMDL